METHALPAGAIALFNGRDLDAWTSYMDEDAKAPWRLVDGCLEVVPGSGDICTRDSFRDFQLHLEFWLPNMPDAVDQDRANSGVYLLGRYEIQILDSCGRAPTTDTCGAIYHEHPPLFDACASPERWQMLDVAVRAPELDSNGLVVEHARVTVHLNGVLIHNNLSLPGPTEGAMDRYEAQPGPLRLQDHGSPVRFRNIWLLPTAILLR
jgi:hypothetical protein